MKLFQNEFSLFAYKQGFHIITDEVVSRIPETNQI